MQEKILTVSGKIPTIPAAFRLKADDYARVVSLCRTKGETLAGYTSKLWQRELETQEVLPNDKPCR